MAIVALLLACTGEQDDTTPPAPEPEDTALPCSIEGGGATELWRVTYSGHDTIKVVEGGDDRISVGDEDGDIEQWLVSTGAETRGRTTVSDGQAITGLANATDGTLLVSDASGFVTRWDFAIPQVPQETYVPTVGGLEAVGGSAKWVVAASRPVAPGNGVFHIWDRFSGAASTPGTLESGFRGRALVTLDADRFAIGGERNGHVRLEVWDASTSALTAGWGDDENDVRTGRIDSLALMGSTLVAAGQDTTAGSGFLVAYDADSVAGGPSSSLDTTEGMTDVDVLADLLVTRDVAGLVEVRDASFAVLDTIATQSNQLAASADTVIVVDGADLVGFGCPQEGDTD